MICLEDKMNSNYIKKQNSTVLKKTGNAVVPLKGCLRDGSRKRGLPVWDIPGCTTLLQLGWFWPVLFPFPSKLLSIANTEHSPYCCLFLFFFAFCQVCGLKHWKNTCWHKLSNWSWQKGTERARSTWQGQCGEKNRTVTRCSISSPVLGKLYLYTPRVLGYNIHNAELILTFAAEMHLRCKLPHPFFQLNKLWGKKKPVHTSWDRYFPTACLKFFQPFHLHQHFS